jgi:hypothetical protein
MKENSRQYQAVRDAILDLVIKKKLDAVDLLIIAERDCSPMPTEKEVGMRIGVSQQAIHKRVVKIRRLISAFLR